jgi:enoyl-CoA hydratase/carnithine racemase
MSQPPDFETLALAADGPVATLALARPQRLNAMSRRMLAELAAAARWLDAQRPVKVVVVSGAGRAFCAGFDLEDFAQPDAELSAWEAADLGRAMAEAVAAMRPLAIAAIRGHCVGGGVVLAAACDLRLAAEDARFSIPEVDLGIPLAWGGIPRLVRELGPAIAKELVLTCRAFGAAEAHALRFVNRVVPPDRLDLEAAALAAELARKPGLVLAATKRAANAAAEEMASTAHAHADAHALASALQDPESRAAGRAYLERRRR